MILSRRLLLQRNLIDFRSDTVTRPTKSMRDAMLSCSDDWTTLGDDVYEECETIAELENYTASLCRKESAMFVCSGTMANQLAIACQTERLRSVVLDRRSHVFRHEAGATAMLSQATMIPISPVHKEECYTLRARDVVAGLFVGDDIHEAQTSLLCLENTLNGVVQPLSDVDEIASELAALPVSMHLDGARLCNASVALGVSPATLLQPFDSASICLSKGLGAPVGSVLVGSEDIVAKARHMRKAIGGGWRQAGMLAAGGLHALREQWDRVADDHSRAKTLADGLRNIGVDIALPVDTNMVWIDRTALDIDARALAKFLAMRHILIEGDRLVVHLEHSDSDIEQLVDGIGEFLRTRPAKKSFR